MLLSAAGLCRGQDIDSLYALFHRSDGSDFIRLANAITELRGDTLGLTAQTPHNEVQGAVMKAMIMHHYDLQQFDDVVRYAGEAAQLYEQTGDTINLAGCCHTLGIAYYILGSFDKAIANYYRSSDLVEAAGADPSGKRRRYTLNNIAAIYIHTGELDLAEKLYIECLGMLNDQETEERNIMDRASYLSNLAKVYCKQSEVLDGRPKQEKLDRAVAVAEEALDLSRKYSDPREPVLQIVQRMNTLGEACLYDRQYARAARLFSEALDIAEENGLRQMSVQLFEGLASVAESTGQRRKADEYYHKAIYMAEENGFNEILQTLVKKAYELNRDENAVRALSYYEKFVALRDSTYNAESRRQINEFQVRYETIEKEHRIEMQQAEIHEHKMRQTWLAVGILLCLAILTLLWRMLVMRRRRNAELVEINKFKDRFLSILSHDLKNPAAAQRNALQVLERYAEKFGDRHLSEQCAMLSQSSEALYGLLENLLLWGQVQTGRMAYTPVCFGFGGMLHDLAVLMNVQLSEKDIQLRDETAGLQACGDRQMIEAVLRNLLSNAVKFSHRKSEVVVRAVETDGMIEISVSDTGTGMSPERLAEPAEFGYNTSTAGTEGEQGSGMGLVVCRELLQYHNSTLSVESEEGKGTKVSFCLPKCIAE